MNNLYYFGSTPERVKIVKVLTCGVCEVRNKKGELFFCHVGDLKRVY